MITSVELNNFLSHRKNIINFDHGVTVLVGHNGAGKSAIMDAIIFSMFGEKRRDSVEKLQKEGDLGRKKIIQLTKYIFLTKLNDSLNLFNR